MADLRFEEEAWRREARTDFFKFACHVQADIDEMPAAHHKLLISALVDVYEGKTDRLMLLLPPGSAKTRYASKLFPAWIMAQSLRPGGKTGGWNIIAASYNADLAEEISGDVQAIAGEHADVLRYKPLSESVALWRSDNRSMYRAAGAGSGITGRRADLFIIDDPIKGREDADSQRVRDRVWRWYRAEVITRLRKGAKIILIQTRWHPDDLAGRLLEEAKAGGDQWTVVQIPQIAYGPEETDLYGDPMPPDPLGRQSGEVLWPEWEDHAAIARKRRAMGEVEFECLQQQRPVVPGGLLFRTERVSVLPVAPACQEFCRAWDLAATEQVGSNNPDWTVGLLVGILSGVITIFDMVRMRGTPGEVETAIKNCAGQDPTGTLISLPQDPGQAGKAQAKSYQAMLMGRNVITSLESGKKLTRATPVIAQVEAGNLAIVKAPWNTAFLDELRLFPQGAKDDIVDALSRAVATLTTDNSGLLWAMQMGNR